MSRKRLIALLLTGTLFLSLLTACGNASDNNTAGNADTPTQVSAAGSTAQADPGPTAASQSPLPPAPGAQADTWLVMIYQDADDETLEQDMFIDLNEAEMIGSTDEVNIIVQIDRMDGGYDGGDDFTTTKRFRVLYDDSGDMETLASEEIEDLGELDMGDKATLVDFATWAIQTYPAGHYALILSDHGMGWPGGWSDPEPNPGSELVMTEIDEALAEIVETTGIGQLDLIGFDACLMAQLESLSAVAPYARYAVASEETEPSLGWAYASFLGALTENPAMSTAELAQKIVFGYIVEDGRITDDEARKSLGDELFSSTKATVNQLTTALSEDITLTAIDLSHLAELNGAVNELVIALQDVDQADVAEARSYAQSYTSIFEDAEPSYIDLGHFAALLVDAMPDSEVESAAFAVQNALTESLLAEKHGPDRPGSTGLSIYFPDADLFKQTASPDWLFYNEVAGRFAAASLWDDFLSFHYTGQEIDPDSADLSVVMPLSASDDFSQATSASAPDQSAEIQRPGGGEVVFNSLTSSAEEITVGDTLTLSVDLSANNIAYVYIYTSYYDSDSDSYLTTDLDFVSAETSKEIGGVAYPDWGDEAQLTLDVDWEPLVWTLSDGETDVIAAAEAEIYGEASADTFYQVWGSYQKARSQQKHDAFLRFDANGVLGGAFIFTSSEEASAPRQIIPQPNDRFTVDEEWLEFDQNPDGEYAYYEGGTVTYGEDGFSMVANEAYSGDYSLGIIVEDHDGGRYEEYIAVTVTK